MAFRSFGAFYSRSFEKRPYLTLAVANGFLGVVADSLAQSFEKYNKSNTTSRLEDVSRKVESGVESVAQSLHISNSNAAQVKEKEVDWDFARSSRFLAFGVGMAPLLCEWNKFIEYRFPLRNAAQVGKVSLVALGKRVAVDQGVFAPFGLVMFVGAMGIMEGRNSESLKAKFSEIYMPALIANWQLWPMIQAVNFRFMPLKYRVPFTGLCGVAWQVFLSLLNANKKEGVLDTKVTS